MSSSGCPTRVRIEDFLRGFAGLCYCSASVLTSRLSALKLEGLRTPTAPFPLITFADPSSIDMCKIMSDADMGGFTKASLDFVPGSEKEEPHTRFHGKISIDLPPDRPNIQRTGYAGWRTKDRGPTLFGKSLWDLGPYSYIGLRVKSDGRKYFVNIQTESIVPTDIHQHRLYTRKPGEWETVFITLSEFVRTNHGMVVEPQREILTDKIRTIGFSLIDRVPGPFDVSISRIWATNRLSEEDAREDQSSEALKTLEKGHKPEHTEKAEAPKLEGLP